MDLQKLARKDLNLLVTLLVVLEEKSVSRAADRLFLTQPAISKALGRLRELFNDPLFSRSGRGLVPTPFAQNLHTELESLLGEISGLFVPEEFEPSTYKGSFRIAVNEFLDLLIMPILAQKVAEKAPGIMLISDNNVEHQLQALEFGEVDFVINLQFSALGDAYQSDPLISDIPTVFARRGHPLANQKDLSREAFREFARVEISMPDMLQYQLFRGARPHAGIQSDWVAGYVTGNLISALSVMSRTDLLLPGPKILSGFASSHLDFIELDMLEPLPMKIDYALLTHERVKGSAVHQWLREQITSSALEFKQATFSNRHDIEAVSPKRKKREHKQR